MSYAILETRSNQFWNGKYTTKYGTKVPRLTKTAYSCGAKTIIEPKLYTSEMRAKDGLEKMWNQLDDLSKHNFNFKVVEYNNNFLKGM